MKEINTSDFKILGKAPYDKPDTKAVMEVIIEGAKDQEKLYGSAFTVRVIKYALLATASQTKGESPEDIKTLDQLKDYLLSKSETLSYPPYYVLLWALFVTAKKFEGSLGAGYQISHRGIIKKVAESEGDVKPLQKIDIDQILTKLYQLAVRRKVAPLESGYKKNEDGTIDIIHSGCYFLDACRLAESEAILDLPGGKPLCGISTFVCQFLKMATGHEWDYTVLEFGKPHCVARCFTV